MGGINGSPPIGFHANMPPQPSMGSLPSEDNLDANMNSAERAKQAYNFHKSNTSTQQSQDNVAMEKLMKELRDAEREDDESRSGSVLIKTDDEYSSDEIKESFANYTGVGGGSPDDDDNEEDNSDNAD